MEITVQFPRLFLIEPDPKLLAPIREQFPSHWHHWSTVADLSQSSITDLPDAIVLFWSPHAGDAVWQNLAAQYPNAKIILAVTTQDVVAAAQRLDAGVSGYLLRPYQPAEWTRLLAEIARQRIPPAGTSRHEAVLLRALDEAPEAIVGSDASGRIVTFNAQAARTLGYTRAQALHKHVDELYERGRSEAQRVMSAMADSPDEHIRDFETTVLHADGCTVIPIRLTAFIVRNQTGQIEQTVGYFHDLRKEYLQVEQITQHLYERTPESNSRRIVRVLADELAAEICLLLRFNHHTVALEPVAAAGIAPEALASISFTTNSLWQTLFEQPPRCLLPGDFSTSDPSVKTLATLSRHGQIASCLSLPLSYAETKDERPFGLLLLLNREDADSGLDISGFAWTQQVWLQMIQIQIASLLQQDWHQQSLQAFMEVAHHLSETGNEQAVLGDMVKHLVTGLGYRAAYLRLVKPDRSLPIWAGAGAIPLQRRFATTPSGQGIVGKAVESGQTIRVTDIHTNQSFWFDDLAVEQNWRGLLVIPIKVQTRVIGVLVCCTALPHTFSDREVTLLTGFANLAAVALNSALLSEQEAKTRKLHQNVIRLMSEQHLEAAWHAILHEAMNLTGAERGSINRVDAQAGWVQPPLVHHGFPREYESKAHPIDDAGSIVGWVAAHKRTVLIHDIEHEPKWSHIYYPGASDTRSELTAPIFAAESDEVVGVINLESPNVGAFTAEHQRILEEIAVYPKIVQENPRLSEQLRRKQSRQRAIRRASSALVKANLTGLTEKEVTQAIIEQAVKVTGADFGTFHLVETAAQDEKALVLQAIYPSAMGPQLFQREDVARILLNEAQGGIIARTARFRYAELVSDVAADDDYVAVSTETSSELAVYVGDDSRILGVINVEHSEPHKFTEEDKDTLIALANLAVIAFELTQKVSELTAEQQRVNRWHLLSRAIRLQAISAQVHQIANHTYLINGWLDNVRTALAANDEKIAGYLQHAIGNAEALRQDVEQLWHYRNPAQARSIELKSFLDEELHKWQTDFEDVAFVLTDETEERELVIDGYPMELRSALRILIENAERAARPNHATTRQQIQIVIRQQRDAVSLTIIDNGPGIDDDILQKLGLDVISSTDGSGTGAIIAAAIIENEHGGRLQWQSAQPQGTAVTVLLPLAD